LHADSPFPNSAVRCLQHPRSAELGQAENHHWWDGARIEVALNRGNDYVSPHDRFNAWVVIAVRVAVFIWAVWSCAPYSTYSVDSEETMPFFFTVAIFVVPTAFAALVHWFFGEVVFDAGLRQPR